MPTFSAWPVGLVSGPSKSPPSSTSTLPEKSKDASFEFDGSIQVTPEHSYMDLTPPSKCAMRRISPIIPRASTNSTDSSSSDAINDQLQQWASLKLSTSSESEFDVDDLLSNSASYEPLFNDRLLHEFKDNYDLPDEDVGNGSGTKHILRRARWTYQSGSNSKENKTPESKKAHQINGGGSPDTATTAPPSFSTNGTPDYEQEDEDDKEMDISAITTDHEEIDVLIMDDNIDGNRKASKKTPPPVASPFNTHSHLNGLRQLLWPAPKAQDDDNDLSNMYEDFSTTFEQTTAAGSRSTFAYSFLQQVTCCAGLVVLPTRRSNFASKSDDDAYLVMDTSVGSFLYLDDDEDETYYVQEYEQDEEYKSSVYDSPELGTSVKQMAKMALAANCSRPSSFDEDDKSVLETRETSFASYNQSTLQDSLNAHFLNAPNKTPASSAAGVANEDELNKSGASSYASGELLNQFYTLDDSSFEDDQTESAVSESSMVTTPRKNSGRDETMSTRSVFTEDNDDEEDQDGLEPPPLRLRTRVRSIASYEDHGFLC
ncbi:hypothetical protein MPSEU_000600700 [Mayamaea pseudoterrestris]|nr:hypothetical protein MPSEU_000600700 [Mayamaea pseudoterrestris]